MIGTPRGLPGIEPSARSFSQGMLDCAVQLAASGPKVAAGKEHPEDPQIAEAGPLET